MYGVILLTLVVMYIVYREKLAGVLIWLIVKFQVKTTKLKDRQYSNYASAGGARCRYRQISHYQQFKPCQYYLHIV